MVDNVYKTSNIVMSHPKATVPIYSFCYTNPTRSHQDLDDVRSISSYRTFLSHNSGTTSKTNIQRINQIKPKAKISVQKYQHQAPLSKHEKVETSEIENNIRPTLDLEAMPYYQNINYQQIKPLFSWDRIGMLCSVGFKKVGTDGCGCDQPCNWKKQWTKNNHQGDAIAYQGLLSEKPTNQNLIQIEKDIHRTFPQNPTFSRNVKFTKMLKEILISYSVYDIQLGYVQGLNNIVGVLLYHIKQSQKTFWALVEMMQYQQLRMIYIGQMEVLQVHVGKIQQLMNVKINDLYMHIKYLGINTRCFLNGWLLSLMSNAIPLQEMHLVLNNFKKQGWGYMYKLILAFLCFLKESLLMSQDEAQFLMNMSSQNYKQLDCEWADIIKSADRFFI